MKSLKIYCIQFLHNVEVDYGPDGKPDLYTHVKGSVIKARGELADELVTKGFAKYVPRKTFKAFEKYMRKQFRNLSRIDRKRQKEDHEMKSPSTGGTYAHFRSGVIKTDQSARFLSE